MVETTPHTQVTKKSKRWQDRSPATKTRITVQGMVQGLINIFGRKRGVPWGGPHVNDERNGE